MPTAFLNDDGSLTLNADGTVMYDDTCCCECGGCSTMVNEFLFVIDYNTTQTGTCNGHYPDKWGCMGSYMIPKITQAEIRDLAATYPQTFAKVLPSLWSPKGINYNRLDGCWYKLDTGLLCDLQFVALWLSVGGYKSSPAVLIGGNLSLRVYVLLGWADGIYALLQLDVLVPLPAGTDGTDCFQNFHNSWASIYPSQATLFRSGVLPSDWDYPPCDFTSNPTPGADAFRLWGMS